MSDSGPPIAGRALEIEFAVVDVRHLREALAQRVEANDVGIHLADAHGDRVDAALQLGLEFLDLGLLFGERRRPGGDAARRLDLLSPIFSPRLKAVARMATSTVANAATASGWPRLKCRARPSRREKKMMFIARSSGHGANRADLYDPVLCASKTCTSLATSLS